MGGFATLHFGFTYPDRARSLVIAGCGYGATPDKRSQFSEEAEAAAKNFEQQGMTKAAEEFGWDRITRRLVGIYEEAIRANSLRK